MTGTLTAPLESIDADRLGPDLDELHSKTTLWAILAVFALAMGLFYLDVTALDTADNDLLLVACTLGVLGGIAGLAFHYRPVAAAVTLIVGLLLILGIAITYLYGALVAPWCALVVLVAGALRGWRAGAAVALITSLAWAGAALWLPARMPVTSAVSSILLEWSCLFVLWLTWRPIRITLAWAWSSYGQAVDQTTKAQERQAELVRLSKSLAESNYQLEQLNLELERARQAALEARRLKSQFAAAVSHELRTPLNLIIGFCEMMVLSPDTAYGERLPANYQLDLQAIYRNACHISALVDDILDLSQIDADRMALHPYWVAPEQIIEDATTAVEGLFRDRRLYLRRALDHRLPLIYVDQTRVRQVLINLLSNAVRHTEKGGVTVRVEQQRDSLVISVADTGPGIPPSEVSNVFEEFYQVGGPGPRRSGSGLGLSVSRRFVELHGGAMWVESVMGQGSTFFVRLPLRADVPSQPPSGADWSDRIGARVRGEPEPRLLVVDEDGEVSKVFQRYLDGYQIVRVANLERERDELSRAGPFRAIVLGTDDAATDRAVLPSSIPELANLPIINCPLRTTRHVADELKVAGYLVKPVSREQLRSALRRVHPHPQLVLVVDDDAEMTRLLSRMVRSLMHGCQVQTTESGREAIALLGQRRPDVVLLDLLMPDVTGYDVLERMRADPALVDVPVLVVTARGYEDEAMIADKVSIGRLGGLTVGEIMRWIRGFLTNGGSPRSAPRHPTMSPA